MSSLRTENYDGPRLAPTAKTAELETAGEARPVAAPASGQYPQPKTVVKALERTSASGDQPANEPAAIRAGVNRVADSMGYGYGKAAVELAEQLQGKSPEYQAQFIQQLNQDVHAANMERILSAAGGAPRHFMSDANVSPAQSQTIAQALGNAYDRGTIGAGFVQQMLQVEQTSLTGNNQFMGDLVGESSSRALKENFFDQSMSMYERSPSAPGYYKSTSNFISGAAAALAGDPGLLQQKLASMQSSGTLDTFLKNLNPQNFNQAIISPQDNSYAKIVNAASKIQPPTGAVLELFRYTASNYMGGNYNSEFKIASAMTNLYTSGYDTTFRSPNNPVGTTSFHSNADFFLTQLSPVGGSTDPNAANALSNFFANTMFNSQFPQRKEVQEVTSNEVRSLANAIKDYPNVGDARTKALLNSASSGGLEERKQGLAFLLGRIDAGVFMGYKQAVQTTNAGNAARDAMVNFLIDLSTSSVGAASGNPALGVGAGAASGLLKQEIDSWINDSPLSQAAVNGFSEGADPFKKDSYQAIQFINGYDSVLLLPSAQP